MKERNDIIRFVAERFNIEPNEDGDWDINDYDWQAGCNHDGVWLNLALVVDMIQEYQDMLFDVYYY